MNGQIQINGDDYPGMTIRAVQYNQGAEHAKTKKDKFELENPWW